MRLSELAALSLLDAGIGCTVYEASGRVGGRMHSDTSSWANPQVTEPCGELIDTAHVWIRGLAHRFGLPLIGVLAAQPDGTTQTYYFFGHWQVNRGWRLGESRARLTG